MGFRLQRSLRLGKFVRLNISKSGIGVSASLAGLTVGSGPRGSYINVNLPGTGLSYRKHFGGNKPSKESPAGQSKTSINKAQAQVQPQEAELPDPGLFAPGHEKELVKAIQAYNAGQKDEALEHLLEAAPKEPGAAIFAAALLTEKDPKDYKAVELLEGVIFSDSEFPTPLIEKYLAEVTVDIEVTPNITATVPVGGLAATLLLVELYQAQRRVREAITLLEEVEELANDPVLTLSLCELYASREIWEGVIERAKNIEPEDDITLEIAIFYGRAMQAQGLHEAAITVFTKALRRKSNRSPHLLNEATYWRAISYLGQGQTGRANKEFQKIYADNPDFRDVGRRLQVFSAQ